jgi:hypothetical protein
VYKLSHDVWQAGNLVDLLLPARLAAGLARAIVRVSATVIPVSAGSVQKCLWDNLTHRVEATALSAVVSFTSQPKSPRTRALPPHTQREE